MKDNLKWLGSNVFAHRGLHDHAAGIPENSMIAFQNAIESGYGIELDVYVIADNEVVVFHDENLKRMCRREITTIQLKSKDLHAYPLIGTKYLIPLLEDVLKLIDGKVPVLIEIKKQRNAKNIYQIIANTILGYRGQMAIMSFNPIALGWFERNTPLIIRGQLSSRFIDEKIPPVIKYLLRNFLLNFISKPDFIAHEERDLSNKLVTRKRAAGIPVLAWTVQSAERSHEISKGCNSFIFENFNPKL